MSVPVSCIRPTVGFQSLLDQQSAEFHGMIPDLLTAMADENNEKLWQIFHKSYRAGLHHGLELSQRRERQVLRN